MRTIRRIQVLWRARRAIWEATRDAPHAEKVLAAGWMMSRVLREAGLK